jgi:hypothetical protein
MDLKHDGLYRSWAFLTTRLVIDKTTLPLLESNFYHFIALEVNAQYNCLNVFDNDNMFIHII